MSFTADFALTIGNYSTSKCISSRFSWEVKGWKQACSWCNVALKRNSKWQSSVCNWMKKWNHLRSRGQRCEDTFRLCQESEALKEHFFQNSRNDRLNIYIQKHARTHTHTHIHREIHTNPLLFTTEVSERWLISFQNPRRDSTSQLSSPVENIHIWEDTLQNDKECHTFKGREGRGDWIAFPFIERWEQHIITKVMKPLHEWIL